MTQKDTLLQRFLRCPNDFTLEELETFLSTFGYTRNDKGKTSGSRIAYTGEGLPPILLHRPHPGNVLKQYQLKQIRELLEKEGLL